MIKRIVTTIFICYTLAAVHVLAQPSTKSMTRIGEGDLNYMFWDVYQAQLYAAQKNFSFDKPYALKIVYERGISKKRLLKTTRKEMSKQSLASKNKRDKWLGEIGEFWQSVDEGDELILYVDSQQVSTFTLNGKIIGKIEDTGFAKAFSSIWLGEKTSKPDLRKDLLNL